MPRAFCLIREQPCYRADAFRAGLAKVGYKVETDFSARQTTADDLLVIWNRYGARQAWADAFEAIGGRVVVAENGYIGTDKEGRQLYALALHGHNGSGRWPRDGGERWRALGIEPKPWRHGGQYVLVCGQRGIGSASMASPTNWHRETATALAKKMPVRLRPHPEAKHEARPERSLAADLAEASAVAIWSSNAGVRALVEGIPVFYGAPHWIGAACGKAGFDDMKPLCDDDHRARALSAVASAQWTVAEIASGAAFDALLAVR